MGTRQRSAGMLAAMKSITRTQVFRAAVGLIALHVADDNFFQPPAGTSAGRPPRERPGSTRTPRARFLGASRASAAAVRALSPSSSVRSGSPSVSRRSTTPTRLACRATTSPAFSTIPAGLTLLGPGRRRYGARAAPWTTASWRYGRRGLFALVGVLVAYVLVFPIGFAYVTTHTARAVVPENRLGAAYENVSFETSDGLTLKGWYVPSKNGAAVISFPGRKGPQKPAAHARAPRLRRARCSTAAARVRATATPTRSAGAAIAT